MTIIGEDEMKKDMLSWLLVVACMLASCKTTGSLAAGARREPLTGATTVSESAREIPVAYQVDVVVVGGSTHAVAAATSAAGQGASVFLAAPALAGARTDQKGAP